MGGSPCACRDSCLIYRFTVVPAVTYVLNGTIIDAISGGGLAAAAVTVKDAAGVSSQL